LQSSLDAMEGKTVWGSTAVLVRVAFFDFRGSWGGVLRPTSPEMGS